MRPRRAEISLAVAGAPLGFISRQLEPGGVGVTARHYARYTDDEDRDSVRREPDEV